MLRSLPLAVLFFVLALCGVAQGTAVAAAAAGTITIETPPGGMRVVEGSGLFAIVTIRVTGVHPVTMVHIQPDVQLTTTNESVQFVASSDPSSNMSRQIGIYAANDDLVEPSPHIGVVYFTAAGSTISPIVVQIDDNDHAGVELLAPAPDHLEVTEGGTEPTVFRVKLSSQPQAPVTLTITGDSQVVATPATITINPIDWLAPQPISLLAVQDDIDEGGDHVGTVRISVTSPDAMYRGDDVQPPVLKVTVHDDELGAPPAVRLNRLPAVNVARNGFMALRWRSVGHEPVWRYELLLRSAAPLDGWSSWQTVRYGGAVKRANRRIVPGRTFCFRLRGVSKRGAKSALTRQTCTTIPVDDSKLRDSVGWRHTSSRVSWLRTVTVARGRSGQLTLSAAPVRLTVVATTCPRCGKAVVTIGSHRLRTISLYSRHTMHQRLITVRVPFKLRNRRGTVRIRSTVRGRTVMIDGLAVHRI